MNADQFATVHQELKQLLACKLFESTELLASLYLSSAVEPHGSALKHMDLSSKVQQQRSQLLQIIGLALQGKGETRRALEYFSRSSPSHGSKAAQQAIKTQAQQHTDTSVDSGEIGVLLSQCECHMDLKDYSAAQTLLQSVRPDLRTLRCHLLSAQCYLASNLKEQAKEAFKAVLALCPLAIEVVVHLARLNVDEVVLHGILAKALAGRPTTSALVAHETWYLQLISTLSQLHSCQIQKNVASITSLMNIFPNNAFLLRLAVEIYGQSELNEMPFYLQLRRIDRLAVDGMDCLALLLWKRKDSAQLSSLASEIIASQPLRCEGYLVAALFCALQDSTAQAFSFIEKACVLNPQHAMNYVTRGLLLQSKDNNKSALIAFIQANSLIPDLYSFRGIIEANMGMGLLKDAAKSAREMMERFPKSPEACFCLGKVLSKAKGQEGVNASIGAFTKTLRMHPRHKEAAMLLGMALMQCNRGAEAIVIFKKILSKIHDHQLLLMLARAYASENQLDAALETLQACVDNKGTKNDPEVLQEIERIEGILKAANGNELAGQAEDGFEDEFEEYDPQKFEDSGYGGEGINRRMFPDED